MDEIQRGGGMLVIGFIAVQCRMIEMGMEEMLTVDFMGMNE